MRARTGIRGIVSFTLLSSSLICLVAATARAAEDEEAAPPAAEPADAEAAPKKKAPPPEPEAEQPPPKAPPAEEPKPSVLGIQIAEFSGWKLTVDGRINSFYVFGWGNHNAALAPETGNPITSGIGTGISADNQIGTNGNFATSRIRSGFVPNVLAFNFTKNVAPATVLSGRVAIWMEIQSNLRAEITPQIYAQEGYLKLEGPWGSMTAGRQLALFNRGAIEIDYNYGHAFGVGWPCNFNGEGPACGQIGYGALFPFFRPGFVYATPSLGGFQVTAGIFDPAILPGKWERVITPTVEGEAALTVPFTSGMFKLFANGVYQQLGAAANFVDPSPANPNPPKDMSTLANTTITQWGVAGGARFELGWFRLGVTGHYGPGLGFNYAQENSPAAYYFAATPTDPNDGKLRTFRGGYAQVAAVFGPVMIAGGVGASQLLKLSFDDTTASPMPKQNLGINAVFNYHIYDNLIWDLDWFRSQSSWYGTAFKQTVDVVSSGFTLLF
jgi:hypothetical protein